MATSDVAAAGRDMSVGSVMTRGFAAIGTAPAAMIGTSLVLVGLPGLLLKLLSVGIAQPLVPGVNPFARLWPAFAGGGLAWWLAYLLAQAVLFRIAVAAIDGRPGRFADHLTSGLRALPALFVLSIVLSIAVGFASLLLLVPGIMLAVAWSVAAPSLVVERTGIFASLGRSGRLTRGARWRIFGACLLIFVIYYLAAGVVGVGNVALTGLPRAGAVPAEQPVALTILSVALQAAFVSVWSAVQAALFVELRDWKDGPAGDRLAEIFA